MNMIDVKGTASLKVEPDFVRVNITLSIKDEESAVALNKSAEAYKELQEMLKSNDFSERLIKCEIRECTKAAYDENDRYVNVPDGFEASYRLYVEFDLDMQKLTSLIKLLVQNPNQPKVTFNYSIKDTQPLYDKLLENSVKDAARKADIMASASHTTVGNVIRLTYGVSRRHASYEYIPDIDIVHAVNCVRHVHGISSLVGESGGELNMKSMFESLELLLYPEPITLEDTVDATFEIK